MADEKTSAQNSPRQPAAARSEPSKSRRKQGPDMEEFTVEFGGDTNGTFMLATTKHRLRGQWSVANFHTRQQGGRDIGAAMSSMPEIPGQRMTVTPKDLRARIWDPLENDPDRMDRINAALKRAMIAGDVERRPVPEEELELNVDQLKTLCAELRRIQLAGHLDCIRGTLPDEDTIEEMPGRVLYDPFNSSSRKPKYADQAEDWAAALDMQQI